MYQQLSLRLYSIRKENSITQKKAAEDLGISQALLSHYEKGIRECGLAFLARACDYYNVSADFLLGRSMEKLPSGDIPQDIPDERPKGSISAALARRLVINSINLLFDLIDKCKNNELSLYASEIFSLEVYKIFHSIYARADKIPGFFTIHENELPYRAAARLAICDMNVKNIIEGAKWVGSSYSPVSSEAFSDIGYDELLTQYPVLAKSLFNLLNNAEKSLLKNT